MVRKGVLGVVVGVEGDGGAVRRRQACAVERQGRGAAVGHVGRALAPSAALRLLQRHLGDLPLEVRILAAHHLKSSRACSEQRLRVAQRKRETYLGTARVVHGDKVIPALELGLEHLALCALQRASDLWEEETR